MMERISEMIEQFLVSLGLTLNRMTAEDRQMVSLFLASLMVAAFAAHALRAAILH